jgi:hypothetical protein
MPGLLTVSGISYLPEILTQLRGHDTASTSDGDEDTRHDLNDDSVVSINREEVETHTTDHQSSSVITVLT